MNNSESYFVSVIAVMDATGVFNYDIYCPFVPTHVIPRIVAYNVPDHGVIIVKCNFVQGDSLTMFGDNGTFSNDYKIQVNKPIKGTYEFRMTEYDGDNLTILNGAEFGMLLEFVKN